MNKKVKQHTVYKDKTGKRLPGVTTIIGNNLGWNKQVLLGWTRKEALKGNDPTKIKDESADIGTIAHYMCECDALGVVPDLSGYSKANIDIAENCFIGYLDWKSQHKVKNIQSEIQLSSEKHGYGGTIDMLYYVGDRLILGDIKTSNALYVEHKIQVAAYTMLCREHGYMIDDVYILQFNKKDGGFSSHKIVDIDKYWTVFLLCLELNKLKEMC